MALHRVFGSPRDRFVFDVSHQSYVHKMLTGPRRGVSGPESRFGEVTGFTNPLTKASTIPVRAGPHRHVDLPWPAVLAKTRDMRHAAAGASGIGNVIAVIGDGSLSSGDGVSKD